MSGVGSLQQEIEACRACIEAPLKSPLPHEPRPVVVLSDRAKIRIIGQAPGVRVHQSGRPFTDPSGDRLRDWLGVTEKEFYDPTKIAITPMGFCFPGLDAKGGDLPPRKECAGLWQSRIDQAMPQIELTLLIGMYAQKHHLTGQAKANLTETVKAWRQIMSSSDRGAVIPLPHPSWRNNTWIKKNPWFSGDLLPELKRQIRARIG